MTNSIEIRYARPRDVEQILDLYEEVAAERDVTRKTGDVWDTILMRKEFA